MTCGYQSHTASMYHASPCVVLTHPSSLLSQVSVFVLDLDDFKGLPKNEREQLFDIYRKVFAHK